MNAAQRVMLFSMFRSACRARGWSQDSDTRAEITAAALGENCSWSDLSNTQIDKLKAHMAALIDPDNLFTQLATVGTAETGERKRLVFAIERDAGKAGFEEGYIVKLARDLADVIDWRSLPLARLGNLRLTIANRARAKRRNP